MSIPFYFAAEEQDVITEDGKQCAQLGFGFFEDGTLRLPERQISGAPAVVNDWFLPEAVPFNEILDRLAEACGNGCFLDFERPLNEVSAAIAVGLRQRLGDNMTVPPTLHALCPEASVQIPGLLCNNWERFVQSVQAQYGTRWVLEIIPWEHCVPISSKESKNGFLQTAICCWQTEDGILRYYDTEETIAKKLAIAEDYGCRAGIMLLQDFENMKGRSSD